MLTVQGIHKSDSDQRRWSPPAIGVVLASAVVVAMVAINLVHIPNTFTDLDVYRLAVRAWWHGGDMYGKLPPTIAGNGLPFIYPPFAVLFLGPLAAVLPWKASISEVLLLSVVSLAVVIYLTLRQVQPRISRPAALEMTAALTALSMALEPVWETLSFGQINLLLMALVALDCLPARTRWPRGLLIGVAAAVKLTPAVFVLYFLLRRDYRAAITATITAMAATALGFVVSWQGSLKFWFGHGDQGSRGVSGSTYSSNQTIDGLLGRLGFFHIEKDSLYLLAACGLLAVAVIGIRRAHQVGNSALAMSLTGCLGLLVSPTSWGHHWVYVVPGAIAMGAYAIEHRNARWALACGATVLTFAAAPYRMLPSDNGAELHWHWWQELPGNCYVIAGVLLLILSATAIMPKDSSALVSVPDPS
jgi:alpha-1,2-mannosyltransferase